MRKSWHDFHGQWHIVDHLRKLAMPARSGALHMPHVLLQGDSGLGKTALARSIARELGTQLHLISCSQDTEPEYITSYSKQWNRHDIVFLDEAHALRSAAQEALYPILDRTSPIARDHTAGAAPQTACTSADDSATQTSEERWVIVTIVAATDQPGKLRNALKRRFPTPYTLRRYPLSELQQITRALASSMSIDISGQACSSLAEACHGIPRIARHYLEHLHVLKHGAARRLSVDDVRDLFDSLIVDKNGLNADMRAYLLCLRARRCASRQTISQQIGLDEATVARDVEPTLLYRGWIEISRSGRRLTESGQQLPLGFENP